MNDPYLMVLINIIVLLLTVIGVSIYRFIYPKKKINLFVLLIILSLLPLISITRPGSYDSGDLSFHSYRTMLYYKILFLEKTLPRWVPNLSSFYGDPDFLFSYIFHYFIGSVLHFIGFSFINSMKILLAASFIVSGIGMYHFMRDEFGKKAAFTSSVFYLYAPYHLVDMHFRVTVGETVSWAFLPILLYLTKKGIKTGNIIFILLLGITLSLLIFTHQVIAATFFPLLIAYGLYLLYQTKIKGRFDIIKTVKFFSGILVGVLLSAFYWVPILFESKFTVVGSLRSPIIFPSFTDLLFSQWKFGFLFQGKYGELSYMLGYTQWFVLIIVFILLFKNKIKKSLKPISLFFLFFLCVFLFLILPISKPIWNLTGIGGIIQFSSRLLVITLLSVSILAGITVKIINRKWFFILLCFMTISYTILNWGNRNTIPFVTDKYIYNEYILNVESAGLDPTAPKWVNLDKLGFRKPPKFPAEILDGKGIIKQIYRNSTHHEYIINIDKKALIKENTLYFPGWNLYINNRLHPIKYTYKEYPGIIIFTLDKGLYKVELIFEDTQVRIISKWVSLLTSLIIIQILILIYLPPLVKKFFRY